MSLLLGLIVFAQSAGSTEADTKIDLAIDPLRFLERSVTLWDPIADAGRLQNQAYGYLFPMGPFYVLCHWLGLAPWSVQRLWQAVLVVIAFLGVVRLTRLLGVAGFWPRIGAGLVYALAPPIVIEVSTISAQLTPTVALPWVMIPLVKGALSGSPRRAAMMSGIALLFAGGTNAAATLAVLPVPALWLLTRRRGPRRAALMRYWLLAVFLATLWWTIPLVLLGKYSPPFLDWIEAAQNTTSTTSLSAAFRGVEHWEAYLGPGIWPAGWILVTGTAAIMATTAVAAAGLAGLTFRRIPHRLFLFSCLLLGLVLITFGHASSVAGPFHGSLRSLLDGPLVAFRNVHKFDPLVRLPLAVGVGLLLSRAEVPWWHTIRVARADLRLPLRPLALALVLGVAAIAITPALTNRMAPDTRTETLPAWWHQTGQWLSTHSDGTRALVVPDAARPVYFWGYPVDDALQPAAKTPWIARSAAPLTQPGTIRLLDLIEQDLATGHGDPTLAEQLRRFGIGNVVLRNDLDTNASLTTPTDVVRATLTSSPGISRAAGFGPMVDAEQSADQVLNGGASPPRRAVEIFSVDTPSSPVGLLATDTAVAVNGSADSVAQLVERGLSGTQPVLTGSTGPITHALTVAGDGIRRQQAGFGNTFAKSATMTSAAPYLGARAAYDYLPDPTPPLSTMRYLGIDDVTASSSGADVYSAVNSSPANGPWAALDGSTATAWRSGAQTGAVGQWLQVRLNSRRTIPSIRVAFAADRDEYPSKVDVRTDSGNLAVAVKPTAAAQTLPVPAGATTTLRLTVRAVSTGGFGIAAGISSLTIPGVHPQRTLDVPLTGKAPEMLAFDAAPGYSDGCLDILRHPVCDPTTATAGEEDLALDRSVRLGSARTYLASATVHLLANDALDRQLDALEPIRAAASSVLSADPRLRPGAAVDGDPATAWSAAPTDPAPVLTLALGTRQVVRGIRLQTDSESAVAAPQEVRIDAGGERWVGTVPASGRIRLDHPVRTDTVSITIVRARQRSSLNTLTGQTRLLPAGIGTVSIEGSRQPAPIALPDTIDFGCDAGLKIVVDGQSIPMQIRAATSAVLDGDAVTAMPCDAQPLELAAGDHRFTLAATPWALPRTLTMSAPGTSLAAPGSAPGTCAVRAWSATDRRVEVKTAARSMLVVRENFNRGWRATVNGKSLTPIVNDGWQQAFLVPAGTRGIVAIEYQPQPAFSAGLLAGLVAALALIPLALWRGATSAGAAGDGLLSRRVQLVLLAAAAVALTALPGLFVVAAALGLRRLFWVRRPDIPVWLPAIAFLAVGFVIATASALTLFAAANSAVSQLLTVLAACLAAIGGLPLRRPRTSPDP